MNKVILLGRVGQQPETRDVNESNFVTNFSLATSERFKNRDGEFEDKTEWHNIVAWNNKFARQYVNKGDQLLIEGQIETRSWETESGEKRYKTEIKAFKIHGVGHKQEKIDDGNQTEQPVGTEDDDMPF